MRKILPFLTIVLALITCGVACHKHTKNVPSCDGGPCALPEAAPVRDVLAQDNWKFSVSGEGWISMKPPIPQIRLASRNPAKNCMLLLIKEPTSQTFQEYVIENVRNLAAAGNEVRSIKQVVINGNKFVDVQLTDNRSTIWLWITVKDGYGYGFSCGGPNVSDAGTPSSDFCQDVANTLEIK